MDIEIQAAGEVVERSELLNGTFTIAIEGQSSNAEWQVGGVLSWNRGLVDYRGEGDLSMTGAEGEVFASLTAVLAEEGGEGEAADVLLAVKYEIDGGSGRFAGAAGIVEGRLRVAGDSFDGTWKVSLREST